MITTKTRQIKEFRYIYNPYQADFYRANGVELAEIGVRNGDIFFKFKDGDLLQSVFGKWMDRKYNN